MEKIEKMGKKIGQWKLSNAWEKSIPACFFAGMLAVLSGCGKDEGRDDGLPGEGGKGTAVVRFTMADSGYGGSETLRGVGEGTKAPDVILLGDGDFLVDCTLEEVADGARTRASDDMGSDVKVRVFAYYGGNLEKEVVVTAGDDNAFMQLESGRSYTITAVSYNTTESPGGSGGITLAMDPTKDVLWATAQLNALAGDNELMLTFDHMFSEVKVEVTSAVRPIENFTQETQATLDKGGSGSTLDLKTGEITLTGTVTFGGFTPSTPTSQRESGYQRVAANGISTQYTLAFPGKGLNVGGITYPQARKAFSAMLVKGKRYRLAVNVPDVGSKTLNGQVWAPGNLHKTDEGPDLWTLTNEYDYGSYADGSYWNWGTTRPWDDYDSYWDGTGGHGSYSVNWTITENDPCKKLGNPWRLPSKAQIDDLVASGIVWGSYAATGPGSNAFGRWFGVADAGTTDESKLAYASAHPAYFVFLPAAGRRVSGNNLVVSIGLVGNYWTNTITSEPNYYNSLTFTQEDCTVGETAASVGSAVRCVTRIMGVVQ